MSQGTAPAAQGTLSEEEIQAAKKIGLEYGAGPMENEARSRGGRYHKMLEMARRLPETSVEKGRSPHFTVPCESDEQVRRVYAALTSTRAREKRAAKKDGRSAGPWVVLERRIDPDHYDSKTGKKGRFTVTLWNAG